MKICFVYQADYPWDVRVEKLVKSIVSRGHEVFLVCRNNNKRVSEEFYDGINIRRLPFLPLVSKTINALISLPFYFSPVWMYYIFKCVKNNQCDAIVVRDLPLLFMSIIIAKLYRKQIIYDMAECYPNMYHSILQFEDNKLINFFLKNHYLASAVEYVSIHMVDHIIVMIEESRDRLLKKGVDSSKIQIIKNTPEKKSSTAFNIQHKYRNKLQILYVGFVTKLRGIDIAIKGLNYYYNNSGCNNIVEFNVIGAGPAIDYLNKLISKYNLNKYVHLMGWCSYDEVKKFYRESDVGILTYPQCMHWNSTIPNKLFDYMAHGLPIIATNVEPIKRIIDEVQCGVTIGDNDYESFSASLTKMFDNKYRNTSGRRGFKAIHEKYNWEIDIQNLWNIL